MTYAYSTDEEHFYAAGGTTREDALEECIDGYYPEPGRTVWTGEIKRHPPTEFMPDADDVLDTMRDRAYDEHGEFAEDWLMKVTPEQEAELTAAIRQAITDWIEKHGLHPTFFSVQDIQAHKVPLPEPEPEPEASGFQQGKDHEQR